MRSETNILSMPSFFITIIFFFQIGCDPKNSLVVTPKKGSAALFYDLEENQHMEGVTDIRSTHAGCDTEVIILIICLFFFVFFMKDFDQI